MSSPYSPGDRVLVAYGNQYGNWQELQLLACIQGPWWVVRTTHSETRAEDLDDNAGVLRIGVRDGTPQSFGSLRSLLFDHGALREVLAEWTQEVVATVRHLRAVSEHQGSASRFGASAPPPQSGVPGGAFAPPPPPFLLRLLI